MSKNEFKPNQSSHPETLGLHGGDYRSDPTTTSVGAVVSVVYVSTTKVVTTSVLLAFPSESVTIIVQSE